MNACNRPGCDGAIEETGFCDTCGRRPASAVPARRSGEPVVEASTTRTRGSGTSTRGDLPPLPVFDPPDAAGLVRPDPEVREDSRFCANAECRAEVGRSYAGQPGSTEGHCQQCGTRFSFSVKLRAGDLVEDRYEVVGALARGGLGWVYLARAKRLNDMYVVLKGLLNSKDERARELQVNEKVMLVHLDHPNVVRIVDFVSHPDPATGEPTTYIVMEYVGGPSLAELKGAAWQEKHGPLRLEHVIAYVREILAALDYLHGRGLLYCDMKPPNAIYTGERLKVIDLGAVRAVKDRDSVSVGTRGYQVGDEEIRKHGLTVRSDLHTVGKTLKVMFHMTEDWLNRRFGDSPVSFGISSLEHVINRATGQYERRFTSAAEMSEQLRGVLREIVALRGGELRPSQSVVFSEPVYLLDGGLGVVPPLDRWTARGPDQRFGADVPAHGLPVTAAVAVGLPVPLVSADDPAASYLATVSVRDPHALIAELGKHRTESVEIHLRGARAHLELGDLAGAETWLGRAVAVAGNPVNFDWRIAWHRGLLALAAGDAERAEAAFAEVYRALPGEEVPKLALGLCLEHRNMLDKAEPYYAAVWRRGHSQVSAAFGLARVRLRTLGRTAAVEILDEVPDTSRHRDAARIAAVRVLCGRTPAGGSTVEELPGGSDLAAAYGRLSALRLDGGEPDGPSRARLTALLHEAELDCVRHSGGGAGVFGHTERSLSDQLSKSLRRLAHQSHNANDFGVLVDMANSVRPRTVW